MKVFVFQLLMHVMRYFWVVYGVVCANVGGATSSEGFLVLCTPSMFWHCWCGVRKGIIQTVKN